MDATCTTDASGESEENVDNVDKKKKSECFDLVMFPLCGRDLKLFEAVAVVSTVSETGPPVLNSFVLLLVPPTVLETKSPLEITSI